MKKTTKLVALLAILLAFSFVLVGCGGDKVVATKESSDSMMGDYKETIEISFKDEKPASVEMSMEFDSKDKAETMYSLYELGMSMTSEETAYKCKQKGKSIVIEYSNIEAFDEENYSNLADMTKDEIIESLEEEGYTVK